MGVAALVLGIVSVIIGFIPLCGTIAVIPAIIGLILGIVDTVKKSKSGEKKGLGIAGIVLNAIAIVIILVYTMVIGNAAKQLGESLNESLANEIINSINSINSINWTVTNSVID